MSLRRLLLLALIPCALLWASAAGAQSTTIAPGVTAGGVDLSGLTAEQATAKLHSALDKKLSETVFLGAGGRLFHLTATEAGVQFEADKTAQNALAAPAKTAVPLVLRHSDDAVRAFVSDVKAKVLHPARNATLRITLHHMIVRRAKTGLRLDGTGVTKLIGDTLDSPTASRTLHTRLVKVPAAVNALDLQKRYATVLTADKTQRKLRLFKHLKISKTYGIAVGQPAYPTPSGFFHIVDKQVDPQWSVPNSPWAGELAGTTVEGGSAANPLKARWLGITDGVGIHGTGEDYSIGQAASHGCLRMHVWDVKALYPRVPIGTPILIK